ncbi:hypothetical protein HPB51_016424 [Rhipicephalus microplus]|uniref:Uncharacterized protein n=1 Tax=Rhipicephalus microplus TaxID=6941 RepID=A0A9J6DAJ5_RHIMP|nr:hypothetical protein HPB51_016424 [Rhipicephalus microplus]
MPPRNFTYTRKASGKPCRMEGVLIENLFDSGEEEHYQAAKHCCGPQRNEHKRSGPGIEERSAAAAYLRYPKTAQAGIGSLTMTNRGRKSTRPASLKIENLFDSGEEEHYQAAKHCCGPQRNEHKRSGPGIEERSAAAAYLRYPKTAQAGIGSLTMVMQRPQRLLTRSTAAATPRVVLLSGLSTNCPWYDHGGNEVASKHVTLSRP